MLLRAAIVIVLVLNLGVAAWWWAGGATHAPDAAPVLDSGPPLRLASEMAPPAPTPSAVRPVALPPAAEQHSPVAVRCVRMGPYPDAPSRDASRTRLEPLAERVLPRQAPARGVRGWRVILPPLASREAATALAERMRDAGISDLYVLNQGEEANAIALGRYGNEEAARRREADLRARGFQAQAEPLGGGPAQWWLDARLRAGVDPASLAGAPGLREVDCATLR